MMRRRHAGCAAVVLVALLAGRVGATWAQESGQTTPPMPEKRWVVDVVHSQIDFRVRHLVGRVRGTFTNWYAIIITGNRDWLQGKVNVTVQTASLNTGNAYRDADLRSPRFFGVDSFPEMTFLGTGIAATDTTIEIVGLLTIKAHTRPVTFTGTYSGIVKDAQGHDRIAFEASTTLDRRDFGINWNAAIGETSLIGNQVEITIALEATRVN
jgi:polyisoprenoid-binding protein YceI